MIRVCLQKPSNRQSKQAEYWHKQDQRFERDLHQQRRDCLFKTIDCFPFVRVMQIDLFDYFLICLKVKLNFSARITAFIIAGAAGLGSFFFLTILNTEWNIT